MPDVEDMEEMEGRKKRKWQDLMHCSVGNTMIVTKGREKRKAGMTARLRNCEHKRKAVKEPNE